MGAILDFSCRRQVEDSRSLREKVPSLLSWMRSLVSMVYKDTLRRKNEAETKALLLVALKDITAHNTRYTHFVLHILVTTAACVLLSPT